MFDFIKGQYILHKKGLKNIGISKINALSDKWLTEMQRAAIFGEGGDVNVT